MRPGLARARALLLALTLLLGLGACGGGQTLSTDTYELRAIDGGWSIEGIKALSEEDGMFLTVPAEIRGKPVLALGTNAFKDETRLNMVFLPEGLTTIGDGAFMGAKLHLIDLPESLTRLGRSAFQDCELGLVTVPAGVTELDMWTFSGASLLNATLEGVTSIGREAFLNCAWMSEVTLPASLTRIGIDAFAGVTGCRRFTLAGPRRNSWPSTSASAGSRPGMCWWSARTGTSSWRTRAPGATPTGSRPAPRRAEACLRADSGLRQANACVMICSGADTAPEFVCIARTEELRRWESVLLPERAPASGGNSSASWPQGRSSTRPFGWWPGGRAPSGRCKA